MGMNTSNKTVHIAQGIYLYARLQDMAPVKVRGSEEEREWGLWCEKYSYYRDFVTQEQYNLFDRVNNTF